MFNFYEENYEDNLPKLKKDFYKNEYFIYENSNDLNKLNKSKLVRISSAIKNENKDFEYKNQYICSVTDNNVYIDVVYGFSIDLTENIPHFKFNHNTFYNNNDVKNIINNNDNFFENRDINLINEYKKYKEEHAEKLFFAHNDHVFFIEDQPYSTMGVAFFGKQQNNIFYAFFTEANLYDNKYYFSSNLSWEKSKDLQKCINNETDKCIIFDYPENNKLEIRFFTHCLFNCEKYNLKLMKNNKFVSFPHVHKLVNSNNQLINDIKLEKINALNRFKIYANTVYTNKINELLKQNLFIQEFTF